MPPKVNRNPESRIPLGMPVEDSDSNTHTPLIVVNHPEEVCAEFEVPYTEKTVADFNEKYSETAPAVQAVYQNQLEQKVEDWHTLHVDELLSVCDDVGLKTYTYPAQRLEATYAHVPERVETLRELICYQCARMTHLAATIKNRERAQIGLIWANYEERVEGEITMSSILKENKYQLKENVGFCAYCKTQTQTTFDHILPVDKGGPDEISNMVPACKACNSSKSNKNLIEWHQEHGIPIDRVVLGKYLKLQWDKFEAAGQLGDTLPDDFHKRWEGLEITRRIDKSIYMDQRSTIK